MFKAWLTTLSATLLLTPSLLAATITAATAAARAGHADEALTQLHSLIAANPNDAAAFSLTCRIQSSLLHHDEAISACEKATSLEPNNSNYSLYLARAYGSKAEHSGAFTGMGLVGKIRTAFERAVSLDPKNIEAISDLGEFYVSAPSIVGGGTGKAEPLVGRLAAISPARSHRLAGMIAAKKNDPGSAESEYQQEIAISHSAESYVDFATYFKKRKQFDQAAENARTAIKVNAEHDGDSIDAAILLLDINRDTPIAIQALRNYLASPNKSVGTPAFRVLTLLGDALAKQGDRAGASQQYTAALALAHDYQPARKASGK